VGKIDNSAFINFFILPIFLNTARLILLKKLSAERRILFGRKNLPFFNSTERIKMNKIMRNAETTKSISDDFMIKD
jgi:hypothetical protein